MTTPNETADIITRRLLEGFRQAMAGRGVKFYALELGLNHETLLHKVEPDNLKDALTLRQVVRLLAMVDAGQVMRPLAESLGGQWLTLPDVSTVGEDVFRLVTETAKEFGDWSNALLAGADPNSPGGTSYTEAELDDCERELDEMVSKARAALAATRSRKAQPAEVFHLKKRG